MTVLEVIHYTCVIPCIPKRTVFHRLQARQADLLFKGFLYADISLDHAENIDPVQVTSCCIFPGSTHFARAHLWAQIG